MSKLMYFWAILLILFVCCEGRNPGAKATVTTRGMHYFRDVAAHFLRREVRNIPIPDQRGTFRGIGDVNWIVSNFRFQEHVEFGTPSIATQGDTIQLVIENISLKVNFFWRWSWGLISDQGNGEAHLKGAKIVALAGISNHGGKLQVHIRHLQFTIGSLDLRISGNMPKPIVDIFLLIFRGLIKKMIEEQGGRQIGTEITKRMNDELSKIPSFVDFHDGFALDYSFLTNPRFLPHTMVTGDLMGEFFNRQGRIPSQHHPHGLPDVYPQSNKMIQMIFGEYTFLTATEVLHHKNLLRGWILDKMVPEWSPVRLNSSSWALILPGLQRSFPNHELRAHLYTTKPPNVEVRVHNTTVHATGELRCYAIDPSTGQHKLAFILDGIVHVSSKIHLSSRFIIPELLFMSQSSTVKESHVGEIHIGTLNYIFNMMFDRGIVPSLNEYLKANPIPLPTLMDFELVDPEIKWENHWLTVFTDVRYRNLVK
jgi:hypothetical protein